MEAVADLFVTHGLGHVLGCQQVRILLDCPGAPILRHSESVVTLALSALADAELRTSLALSVVPLDFLSIPLCTHARVSHLVQRRPGLTDALLFLLVPERVLGTLQALWRAVLVAEVGLRVVADAGQ